MKVFDLYTRQEDLDLKPAADSEEEPPILIQGSSLLSHEFYFSTEKIIFLIYLPSSSL